MKSTPINIAHLMEIARFKHKTGELKQHAASDGAEGARSNSWGPMMRS